MSDIKGYKVLDEHYRGYGGFQYAIGETYEHEGELVLYKSGFHYCERLINCFSYYEFNPKNKVIEVSILGDVVKDSDNKKRVTNKIRLDKELPWEEVLRLVNTGNQNTGNQNTGNQNTGHWNTGNQNTGHWNTGNQNTGNQNTGNQNTGYRNTGYRNTGHWNTGNQNTGNQNTGNQNTGYQNTGYRNTGYRNTGNQNTGNRNTGDWNTGHWNTGNQNTGYRNTGDWNTGDWNTGDWNSCNYSSGIFCTKTPHIHSFNRLTDITMSEFKSTPTYQLLLRHSFNLIVWISSDNMTDEEKEKYPQYNIIGGYLKEYSYKEACQIWWGKYSEEEKVAIVKGLPNFNPDIFYEITGIQLEGD